MSHTCTTVVQHPCYTMTLELSVSIVYELCLLLAFSPLCNTCLFAPVQRWLVCPLLLVKTPLNDRIVLILHSVQLHWCVRDGFGLATGVLTPWGAALIPLGLLIIAYVMFTLDCELAPIIRYALYPKSVLTTQLMMCTYFGQAS